MKIERAIEEQRVEEILRQLQENKTDYSGISLVHLFDKLIKANPNLSDLLKQNQIITTYLELTNAITACGSDLPSNKRLRSYIKRLYQGLYQLKQAWSTGQLANQAENTQLNQLAVQNLLQVWQQQEPKFFAAFKNLLQQKFLSVSQQSFEAWRKGTLEISRQELLEDFFGQIINQTWQVHANNSAQYLFCNQLENNMQLALLESLKNNTLPHDLSQTIRTKLRKEVIDDLEIISSEFYDKLFEEVSQIAKQDKRRVKDNDYENAFDNKVFTAWQVNLLPRTLTANVEAFMLKHIKAIKINDAELNHMLRQTVITQLLTQFKTSVEHPNSNLELATELEQYLQVNLIASFTQGEPIYAKTQGWLLEIILLELVQQWQSGEFKAEQLEVMNEVLLFSMQQQLDKLSALLYPANTVQSTIETLTERVQQLEQMLAALTQQLAAKEIQTKTNKKLTNFFAATANPVVETHSLTNSENKINEPTTLLAISLPNFN